MTRLTLINAAAALTLFIAPYATAAETDFTPSLQPLVTEQLSEQGSFFAPKSAEQIQDLAVIDEDLEESLVWEKQGS